MNVIYFSKQQQQLNKVPTPYIWQQNDSTQIETLHMIVTQTSLYKYNTTQYEVTSRLNLSRAPL